MKEIVKQFSPGENKADLSILYEVTGFQTEVEDYQFWENYADFDDP